MKPKFTPGEEVVVRSSGELVEVVAQDGDNVLVKRTYTGGAQWTHSAADLMPYGVCPI